MKRFTRICVLASLVLGYGLTTFASSRLKVWLTDLLEDGALARSICVTSFTLLWVLPAFHARIGSDLKFFGPCSTWTILLLLPYPIVNMIFGQALPADRTWGETAHLMWFAISISVFEEFLFRGYGLHKSAGHPQFAILVSSLAFTFVHWLGGHAPLALLPVFCFGIAFGIVRIVTVSLFWCLIFHGMTNLAAAVLVPRLPPAVFVIYLLAGLVTMMVLLRHPKLRAETTAS